MYADDEDSSYAITAILALGAFGLFTFPLIGHALGMGDHTFLLISLLTTFGFFSKPQIADLANLSRWAFLLTVSRSCFNRSLA